MSIPGTDWCGPYRSDGRDVQNTCGYATARSEFDQSCKDHDCCLDSAGNNPLEQDSVTINFFMIITAVVFLRTTAATAINYGYRPYRTVTDMFRGNTEILTKKNGT